MAGRSSSRIEPPEGTDLGGQEALYSHARRWLGRADAALEARGRQAPVFSADLVARWHSRLPYGHRLQRHQCLQDPARFVSSGQGRYGDRRRLVAEPLQRRDAARVRQRGCGDGQEQAVHRQCRWVRLTRGAAERRAGPGDHRRADLSAGRPDHPVQRAARLSRRLRPAGWSRCLVPQWHRPMLPSPRSGGRYRWRAERRSS